MHLLLAAVSLPTVIPPTLLLTVQFRITTFSVGNPLSFPSIPLPAFKVKASSPQSKIVFSIRAFFDESISIPSVEGAKLQAESILTPLITTFLEYNT